MDGHAAPPADTPPSVPSCMAERAEARSAVVTTDSAKPPALSTALSQAGMPSDAAPAIEGGRGMEGAPPASSSTAAVAARLDAEDPPIATESKDASSTMPGPNSVSSRSDAADVDG